MVDLLNLSFPNPLIEPRLQDSMSRPNLEPQTLLVGSGCSNKELASQMII